MLSSAAAVADLLGALLGYTTRSYEKTFAIRQFSEGLAGRVCDGYNRGNRGKGANRVNAYLGGGATCGRGVWVGRVVDATMLRENEGVREKRISFFRRPFEAVVVGNPEVCNVMFQLVSMFLQTDSECV